MVAPYGEGPNIRGAVNANGAGKAPATPAPATAPCRPVPSSVNHDINALGAAGEARRRGFGHAHGVSGPHVQHCAAGETPTR